MAVASTGVPGPGSPVTGDLSLDLRGAIPYSNWQIARFLLLDVGTLLIPGGAFLSGLSKAKYLRRGIKLGSAAKKEDKALTTAQAAERAIEQMPVRTGFLVGGVVVTASDPGKNPVHPLHAFTIISTPIGDVLIGHYVDRLGRIINYVPSEKPSPRAQGTVLPAARKAPQDLATFQMLEILATTEMRGHPSTLPILGGGGRRTTRINPDVRSRPKGQRARKLTRSPWCPRHKRKHWCPVTRAQFT